MVRKSKPANGVDPKFHLTNLADATMSQMNGHAASQSTASKNGVEEKNVSLQVKESIRTRLRKMSAAEDKKIQGFVERALDKALLELGY